MRKVNQHRLQKTLLSLLLASVFSAQAATDLKPQTESAIKTIQPQMLEWRRHFHQYPEQQHPSDAPKTTHLIHQNRDLQQMLKPMQQ